MILRHKAVLEFLRAVGHDPDKVAEVHVTPTLIEVITVNKDGDEEADYIE